MPIEIIRRSDLAGTARHLRNETYETFRFLMAPDGTGVTVTDITLAPGIEAEYGYDNHIEMAYCLQGRALIIDGETGARHEIVPGTMWVARRGVHFRFRADEPTRCICVFTPAFEGNETGFKGDQ